MRPQIAPSHNQSTQMQTDSARGLTSRPCRLGEAGFRGPPPDEGHDERRNSDGTRPQTYRHGNVRDGIHVGTGRKVMSRLSRNRKTLRI